MKVALFCGGRGSAALIRELLTWPHVELSLLVNAYDDGLSTGEIRDLFPGLLGPSDFRKNIISAMAVFEPNQIYLRNVFEHRLRLPGGYSMAAASEGGGTFLIESDKILTSLFSEIKSASKLKVLALVDAFLGSVEVSSSDLPLEDAAFGNIIFAGAYLKNGNSFSGATRELASIFEVDARIVNVSDTNAFLVGELEDGSYLLDESAIVSYHGSKKIVDIHFSPTKLSGSPEELVESRLDKSWLPDLNPEVLEVLEGSDLIILGSGTQHSSLLPSYKILDAECGLTEFDAKVIFVSNLDEDADITGWSIEEIVGRAEDYLGVGAIDTVLIDSETTLPYDLGDSRIQGRALVRPLRHPQDAVRHSGILLHDAIREALEDSKVTKSSERVKIFVDSSHQMADVFLYDLEAFGDWSTPHLESGSTSSAMVQESGATALSSLKSWASETGGEFDYFICVDGPGRYEVSDAVKAMDWMASRGFGLALGSRTHSRLAWKRDVGRKYMGSSTVRALAVLGGILASVIIALKLRVILSDPLTRCFVFSKAGLGSSGRSIVSSASSIEQAIVRVIAADIQTVEFPVRYRSMTGFRRENPLLSGLGRLIRLVRAN
jgi:2-phospho-L-lactate transferase/gluconeogenesis factor (CofD/UPF0052 family)